VHCNKLITSSGDNVTNCVQNCTEASFFLLSEQLPFDMDFFVAHNAIVLDVVMHVRWSRPVV